MVRIVFIIVIVAVAATALREFLRWRDPQFRRALTGTQRQRRVYGTAVLIALGGMCLGGTYLPGPLKSLPVMMQARELLYWSCCLLLGFVTVVIGALEARETTRILKAEQAALTSMITEPIEVRDDKR